MSYTRYTTINVDSVFPQHYCNGISLMMMNMSDPHKIADDGYIYIYIYIYK